MAQRQLIETLESPPMRNEETERLGDQLQVAFEKSGMSPQDFAFYCYENKEAVVGFSTDPEVTLTVVGDEIYTFYFNTRWYCKV